MASRGYQVSSGNPIIITRSKKGAHVIDDIDSAMDFPVQDAHSDLGSSLDYLPDYPAPSLKPSFFEQSTQSYSLNNVIARDVFPVVDIFLRSSNYSGGSAVVDEGTNAIVVTTTLDNHKQLTDFLPQIDVSRNQVLIESIMFETTNGNSFDFSFGFGKRIDSTIVGGVNTSSLGSVLSFSGGSFGIFSGNVLSLALTAVETDKQSKLLSAPRILTSSGKRGFISSGQNVPIVTGKIVGEGIDIKNPFQTIERRDIGISLDVVPVVLNGNKIMLTIKSKADSISNISSTSDIVFNQRMIDTTVQLKDGDTLLIGGLIQHNAVNSSASTPGASDIPLIGWLFDSNSKNEDSSVMYILIRARILRTL
ncbi:MAG: secretin N-terminal domain-containing protein [Providencia heimbachae]|nr:secretin N-terminal domain-containing protein [Providencia heimbachae]